MGAMWKRLLILVPLALLLQNPAFSVVSRQRHLVQVSHFLTGPGFQSGDSAVGRHAAEVSAEPSAKQSLETLFFRSLLGVVVPALPVGVVATKAVANGSLTAHLGAAQTFQVLLVTMFVLKVMQSAAARDRLGGTTFRVLALGLLASFFVILFDSLYHLGHLLPQITSTASASWVTIIVSLVILVTSYISVTASYKALEEHGLPSFKFGVISKGAAPLSLLAIGYAVTAMHSLGSGAILTLYSPMKIVGVLRCFVVAGCAHVCQTAAVAGAKRLASETYILLNLALILDSVARLGTLKTLGMPPAYSIIPAIALLSSAGGWLVGKTAGKK